MRCKNCGWENGPDRTRCEKCNAPLTDSALTENAVNQNVSSGASNLKGTIPEGQVFSNEPFQNGEPYFKNSESISPAQCPKCGYPIARGMNVCPQCGISLQNNARQGTINPWATPQKGTFCTLKPVPWENENTQHSPLTFSGTAIPLNRANTDPNNQTITSHEQAELTYEDGSWYICDKSAQKTTYVHAGRKTKLEKGDIIILGNRQFVFNG